MSLSEPAPQHGHNRLDFIQALRGLAALGVVLYHCRPALSDPAYGGLGERLFGWGAAGVDLFFVVSGFIMVHATARAGHSVRGALEFLARRIARIWPVYMVWMAIDIAVVSRFHHIGWSLPKSIVFYPSGLQPAPTFGHPPNVVGWTINYEVWFYVLFALSLMTRRRWLAFAALMATFTVVIPLAVTGSFHTSAYETYELPTAILRLAADPMTWDFAAGVAIGLIYRSRFHVRHEAVLLAIVVVAVAGEIWILGSGYRQGYGPAAWGGPIMITVLALALWDKQRRIRVPRWMIWLGDVSFSLYLAHRIPLIAGASLLPRALATGFPYIVAVVAASLVLADLSARWLERGLAERVRVRLVRLVR